MEAQALSTVIDEKSAQIIEPSLADRLIQEAQDGPFNPQIGTARWANPILAAGAYPYEPGAIWLGRNPVNENQAMGYKDDRHVLVCAGTRTGKGRTIIVNNLALWPGSICTIDPKGENATILSNRRGPGSNYCDGLGQDVFVFDPFHCAQVADDLRAYFDPIETLKADDPALPRKVGRLAEATTIIPEGESAEWAKRGRQMIATIILHVITSDRFDGKDEQGRKYRSLVTVRRLITAGDTRAYEQLKEMGADSIPPAMELLWDAIAHNAACDGIISDQGESNFQSLKHHREYFESVRKSAAENTDWIDDPQMRQTLIGGENAAKKFKPKKLKNSPKGQSIFLCLPVDDMPVYGRWQRVIIATVISEMQKTQGLPKNGHPLLMCLDEFPALGTMERLEKAAAEIAGAGVKLMTIVQNLPQLQKLYKKGWETFLGNSGLQIFFGMDDNTTRGYLEKALGEMEIIKRIRTENRGVSEQITEGQTKGHSEGTSTGSSTGTNETWQTSQGENTSQQSSRGGNTSWGNSNSTGSSWNNGQSGGSNSGSNYNPGLFFGRHHSSFSEGQNKGWNSGQGGNTSQSSNKGKGKNWSQSSSTGKNSSTSQGGGTNKSETTGTSHQTNFSEQNSSSRGSQNGESIAESVHKKPLLAANEADKLFALISDKDHNAYPGMALVKISGQDAMFVRKTNYDEDQTFIRCFDPNPAHPFIELKIEPELSEPKIIESNKGYSVEDRTFSNQIAALDEDRQDISADLDVFRTYREYKYESTITFHLPKALIWFVITRSEMWQSWMEIGGFGELFTSLPASFGPGSQVKHIPSYDFDEGEQNAVVISGDNKETLTIKYSKKHHHEKFYLTIATNQISRTETIVSLTTKYYHPDRRSNLAKKIGSLLGNRTNEKKGHREGYDEECFRILRRLENLCEEYFRFNLFHWENSNTGYQYYEIWNQTGELEIYPDFNNNRILAPGTILEKDEIVGRVNCGSGLNIKFPRKCRILNVLKNHGDIVRPYERLFLVEYFYDD